MSDASSARSFAGLASVAFLVGLLSPFGAYLRAYTRAMLGQPVWPLVVALLLAVAIAALCVRVLSSHGARWALVVSVVALAAPLLVGFASREAAAVGGQTASSLLPLFPVAIGLACANGRAAPLLVGGLALCGTIGGTLAQPFAHGANWPWRSLTDALLAPTLGVILIAGAGAAAWLLPWPAQAPRDSERQRPLWVGVLSAAFGLALTVLATIDPRPFLADIPSVVVFYVQTLGLSVAIALCLLPLSPRWRAAGFFAVSLLGEFAGGFLNALLA